MSGAPREARVRLVAGIVLAVLFAAAAILALVEQRGDARYAPLLVSSAGALLAFVETGRGLVALRRGPAGGREHAAGEREPGSEPTPAGPAAEPAHDDGALWWDLRRSGSAWLLGMLACFLLLGTLVTAVVIAPLYMRVRSRRPWRFVALTTLFIYVSVEVLLNNLLRLQMYDGLIPRLL